MSDLDGPGSAGISPALPGPLGYSHGVAHASASDRVQAAAEIAACPPFGLFTLVRVPNRLEFA